MTKICVFCSSVDNLSKEYIDVAGKLGKLMGEKGHHLVYGGSHRGLMGEVSKSFAEHSEEITEIIPKLWQDIAVRKGNTIVTEDFGERLRKMQSHSDAFITLPGGFGSLHELLNILVAKQLKFHQKPLVIINTNEIYNPIITQIKNMIDQGFIPKDNHQLIQVVSTPEEALHYI